MAIRFPVAFERAVTRAVTALPPPLLRRVVGGPRTSPDGLELDLQLQTLLWLIDAFKIPPFAGGSVEEARAQMERSAPTLDLRPAGGVAAYDRTLPGASSPRRARVYTPAGVPSHGAPALVYFHGGGWVVGSIDSHDRLCRALADRAGVVVLSFDYRLAPEHPFPAAHDDAVAATRWVLANAERLGLDPGRVAVGGDSAGGNLSAVVSLALRGEGRRPAFQLLLYPATDCTRSFPSHGMFRDGFFLGARSIDWYLGHYLPRPEDWRDPRASPYFAADVARAPAALVLTAGFDPLRDEGKAYADRLRDAGVPAEYVCAEGQMHGFLMLGAALREAEQYVDLAADRLRRALARPS
ncbi:MAG TPA: alpha/beta hydrolase [Polyangiaceae bacterium]|jgi:acetyl esterase